MTARSDWVRELEQILRDEDAAGAAFDEALANGDQTGMDAALGTLRAAAKDRRELVEEIASRRAAHPAGSAR